MSSEDELKKSVVKYVSASYFEHDKTSSLEQYALIHFTSTGSRPLYRTYSGHIERNQCHSIDDVSHLWKHTKELIKRPLLKETCILSESLQQKACYCFKLILKYMGDYPTKKLVNSKIELLNELFQIPLTFVKLRNEIYCQIIKQVTRNKMHSSQEKGWELLWLAAGLFSCTDVILQNEMECFVQTYETQWPITSDIMQRLKDIFQLLPPHPIELDAVQRRLSQIFYKIYLPDNSTQIVQIKSTTKCGDIRKDLVKQVGLQSSNGFSLVLSINDDKVIAVDDNFYFFDILSYYTNSYTLHEDLYFVFMKTHWINVNIGKDPKADIHFYYDQELSKYIYGYHKLSFEDAVLLGSYVYRALFGAEPFHIESINNLILDLIPPNVYRMHCTKDWSESILNSYRQHSISTSDEAKLKFLKYLSRWPTFASHFIFAKQNETAPVNIAINERHVLIIDSNQDIISTYLLTLLISWSYSTQTNKFTFNTTEHNLPIQFDTPYCYELSQLLVYYTEHATANKDIIQTKHRISIICDSLVM